MNIWTIEGFEGYHSENTSAVVVADNPQEAAYLLKQTLKERGLPFDVNNSKFERLLAGTYDVRIMGDLANNQYNQWLQNNPDATKHWFTKKMLSP